MQALDADSHDLDTTLQHFNQQRHGEVLALHKLDMVARSRGGLEGRWHPHALANRFDSWLKSLLSKLRGPSKGLSPYMAAMFGSAPYRAVSARSLPLSLMHLMLNARIASGKRAGAGVSQVGQICMT